MRHVPQPAPAGDAGRGAGHLHQCRLSRRLAQSAVPYRRHAPPGDGILHDLPPAASGARGCQRLHRLPPGGAGTLPLTAAAALRYDSGAATSLVGPRAAAESQRRRPSPASPAGYILAYQTQTPCLHHLPCRRAQCAAHVHAAPRLPALPSPDAGEKRLRPLSRGGPRGRPACRGCRSGSRPRSPRALPTVRSPAPRGATVCVMPHDRGHARCHRHRLPRVSRAASHRGS